MTLPQLDQSHLFHKVLFNSPIFLPFTLQSLDIDGILKMNQNNTFYAGVKHLQDFRSSVLFDQLEETPQFDTLSNISK
jgi:hypothetical protein